MKKSGPALHAAVINYLAALQAEGAPHGTVKQYRSILLRLCKRLPERQYRGVAAPDLAGFLYGPEGITTGRAAGTGTVYRAALRSFFAYGELMGWGRAPTVPNPVIRQRGGRRAAAPPTRLSPGQLQLLLSESDNLILRGMLAVAMNTALRISDVMKLQLEHLDLRAGEIAVWVKKTREFDAMPVTLDLDEELRAYLTWYTERTGVTLDHGDAFLFPGWVIDRQTQNGFTFAMAPERHVSYTWANEKLHELLKTCGIRVEKSEAWHVIRRSVARIYFDSLRGGISHDHALRQTAALLGHKNVATTERYLGLQAEVEARNVSLRGQRFFSLPIGVTRFGSRGSHPFGAGTRPDDQAM